MILQTLSFSHSINISVQVGDFIYYTPLITVGSVSPIEKDQSGLGGVIQLGPIFNLTETTVTVMVDDANIALPLPSDFIMFGKDKTVNTSSLIGYYADVKFINNSTEEVELFSVGSEVFESSK